MWHVESGNYDGVSLDGTTFGQFGLYPEAIHLGNGTVFDVINEKLSPEQRQAVETILTEVVPFSVFHDLSTNFLGFQYVPMELHLDGIRSASRGLASQLATTRDLLETAARTDETVGVARQRAPEFFECR